MAELASAPTAELGDAADPEASQPKNEEKIKVKKEPDLPEVPPDHLISIEQSLWEIWRNEDISEEIVRWFYKIDVDVKTVKDLATMVPHAKEKKDTEAAFKSEVIDLIQLKIVFPKGPDGQPIKPKKGQKTERELTKEEARAVTAAFSKAVHMYQVKYQSVLPAAEFEPEYNGLSKNEWLGEVPVRNNRYPQGSTDTMTFKVEAWLPVDEKKEGEGNEDEEAHHHAQQTGRKKDRPAVDSIGEWKRIDDEKNSTALTEKIEPLKWKPLPETNPYTQGKQRQVDADCNRIDSIIAYGKAAHPQGIAHDVMDWGKRMIGFGSSQHAPQNPNAQPGKKHTAADLKENDKFYIEDWKDLDSNAALDALDRSAAHKSIFDERMQQDKRHKQWEQEREKTEKKIMAQAETKEEGIEACRFASVDYEALNRWKCGTEAPEGFA